MKNLYYELTVSTFIQALTNLQQLLIKGQKLAEDKKISEAALLGSRIAPDMFPLIKQVQIATDNAKGAAARLSGVDIPVLEDNETTIADLCTRIDRTVAFLRSLSPEKFIDADTRKITLGYFPNQHFIASNYLTQYALPNFFFHITTAYAILRMLGLEIGKGDFLGTMKLEAN